MRARIRIPRLCRHPRPQCRGHPQALRPGRHLHLRSRLHLYRVHPIGITFIDGDKGVLQYRGYSIADLAEHSTFLETCYLLLYGDLPNQNQMERFSYSITRHTMVHEQLASFLLRLPPRRPSHGDHVRRGGRAVGLLFTTPPTSTIRSSAKSPATGWWPSCPRSPRWPTNIPPATFCVSPEQAWLYREFPAHDLLGPGRGLCGQSGTVQGVGYHLHPPCRPRAECLDLNSAPGRLVGRQSVCLHRGGHRLPVGTRAWRRQ